MKFCPVVSEICPGQVHGPQKERKEKEEENNNNKKQSKHMIFFNEMERCTTNTCI
jgi:hypothetical protein